MGPLFVTEVPSIEIEDGLVHVCYVDGRECYWRPSTFWAFVDQGRHRLNEFDRKASGAVMLRAKG